MNGLLRGVRALRAVVRASLGRAVPLRITHCLTYRCNLACHYCRRHEASAELDTEQVKRLMSELRRAGTLFWSFNGGEALLREDLGELIAHGKRLGYYLTVATNGVLVPSRIGILRDVDRVSLSLDGARDVHDRMRCQSHDAALAACEALHRARVPFHVVTVIAAHNVHDVEYPLQLCERYGARAVFQPVRVQSEDREGAARAFFPTREAMRAAMDHLALARAHGRPVASSAAYLQAIQKSWPDGPPAAPCWAGRLYGFVTPDGRMTHCCDTLHDAMQRGVRSEPEEIARAFAELGPRRCDHCYSAVPLELNVLFSSLLRSPGPAALQVWRNLRTR